MGKPLNLLAGGLLRRGGRVLRPGRRLPQARLQRLSRHGRGLRRRVATPPILAGRRRVLHAHLRRAWGWRCWCATGWPCWNGPAWSNAAFQCANALMSLSFVAAALITLSRLATRPGGHPLVARVPAAGADGAEPAGGVAGATRGLPAVVHRHGDCRGRPDLHHPARPQPPDALGEAGNLQRGRRNGACW